MLHSITSKLINSLLADDPELARVMAARLVGARKTDEVVEVVVGTNESVDVVLTGTQRVDVSPFGVSPLPKGIPAPPPPLTCRYGRAVLELVSLSESIIGL